MPTSCTSSSPSHISDVEFCLICRSFLTESPTITTDQQTTSHRPPSHNPDPPSLTTSRLVWPPSARSSSFKSLITSLKSGRDEGFSLQHLKGGEVNSSHLVRWQPIERMDARICDWIPLSDYVDGSHEIRSPERLLRPCLSEVIHTRPFQRFSAEPDRTCCWPLTSLPVLGSPWGCRGGTWDVLRWRSCIEKGGTDLGLGG